MSDNILILDTSIGTSNIGDEIIMECVMDELKDIIADRFVFKLPTHVAPFHWYQVLRNSAAVRNYSDCALKFVGGSNLLVKDMLTHYPQWNINLWNYMPLKDCILVGVGASAHDKTNWYTRRLYHKLLNNKFFHSVRDERTKEYLESLGIPCINTGCVTMWKLTPEFCKSIPESKASQVVFTLTAGPTAHSTDRVFVDILRRNYDKVYFWVQGDKDLAYFKTLGNTQGIEIVPPRKEAYDRLLGEEDIEYVGTRLHAGVYAMRHARRAVIIVVDERAREINKKNNLVCLERDKINSELEQLINLKIATEITMPLEQIEKWRSQFAPWHKR